MLAISFSNAWKRKVKVKSLSRVRLLVTPWTAADQAPLSMGFSRQNTGVGCHCLLRNLYNTSSTLSFLLNSSRGSQKKPPFFHLTFCPILRSVLISWKKKKMFSNIWIHCQFPHKKGSLGTLVFTLQVKTLPSFFLAFQIGSLFPFSLLCNTKSLGLVCSHRKWVPGGSNGEGELEN